MAHSNDCFGTSITVGPRQNRPPRNQVWVRAEIGIENGVPTIDRLAEVFLSPSDEHAQQNIGTEIAIQFHAGLKSWTLMTDNGRTKIEYEPNTLSEVITHFEERVGIKLPDVWMIEPGVGRYRAAEPFVAEDRAWNAGLVLGATYSCEYKPGDVRQFVVTKGKGALEIAWKHDEANADGVMRFSFEAKYMTLQQWQTIKLVSLPAQPFAAADAGSPSP